MYPYGRLNDFQRHKVRLWGIYSLDIGRIGNIDIGGLWRYNSGQVYSLVSSGVRLTAQQHAILDELGYPNRPTSQPLYYGARNSEGFDGYGLFDLSVQFERPIWRSVRPYVKFELFNVFNNDALIAWNTVVHPVYDGPTDERGLPTTYEKSERFGEGTSTSHYPPYLAGVSGGRTFRMALGLRF